MTGRSRPLVQSLDYLDRRPRAVRADDDGGKGERRLAPRGVHERPVDRELGVVVVRAERPRLREEELVLLVGIPAHCIGDQRSAIGR